MRNDSGRVLRAGQIGYGPRDWAIINSNGPFGDEIVASTLTKADAELWLAKLAGAPVFYKASMNQFEVGTDPGENVRRTSPDGVMARTKQACVNCRFAHHYTPPSGEQPELPKLRKTRWFDHPFVVMVDVLDYRIGSIPALVWADKKRKAETKIQCRRFPEPTDRPKEYMCGEYLRANNGD